MISVKANANLNDGAGNRPVLFDADDAAFHDPLRSSDLITIPRDLAVGSIGFTSGRTLARLAQARSAKTFTKCRFHSAATGAGCTNLRIGVFSPTGVLLSQTADLSGTWVINTLFDNIALGTPVVAIAGQRFFIGIGTVASTALTFRGAQTVLGIESVSPALIWSHASVLTAGSNLVNLTGSPAGGGGSPWVELIP